MQAEDLLQHLEQHITSQPGMDSAASHVVAMRIVRDPATNSSKVRSPHPSPLICGAHAALLATQSLDPSRECCGSGASASSGKH